MQAKLPDGSVIICGILAKDADYRQVGQKNSSLTKFSVKVGERIGSGEAIWVNCVCWHSVARATMNLKKLDVVMCVGKIEQNNYTAKDGTQKTGVQLNCEAVFVQPASMPATNQGGIPNDFEEVFSDEGTPF